MRKCGKEKGRKTGDRQYKGGKSIHTEIAAIQADEMKKKIKTDTMAVGEIWKKKQWKKNIDDMRAELV